MQHTPAAAASESSAEQTFPPCHAAAVIPALASRLLRSIGDPKRLGSRFQDHSRRRQLPQVVRQQGRVVPPLEQQVPICTPYADLGFPSTQIDRTMLHGWFLLLAPRARKCVSDGTPSARWMRSQPLHRVWTSSQPTLPKLPKER